MGCRLTTSPISLKRATVRRGPGTSDGLAWFDGYVWTPIDADLGAPAQRVQHLAMSPRYGVLAVLDNHLYVGDQNGFRRVRCVSEGERLVEAAVPFAGGQVLIQVWDSQLRSGSLLAWDGSRCRPFDIPSPVPQMFPGQANINIWSTRRGGTWLNTTTGLYRWTEGAWERVHLWTAHWRSAWENATTDLHRWFGAAWEMRLPTESSWHRVCSVAEDEGGGGIISMAALTAEQRTLLWEWHSDLPTAPHMEGATEPVQTVALGPGGEAIVIYKSGGVSVRRDGDWVPLAVVPRELTNVLCAQFRESGDLWVGTERGLLQYRTSSPRWTRWAHPFPDNRNWVHEVLVAGNGDVWIATAEGIDIHHCNGRMESINRVLGTTLGVVTGIAEDKEGRIWISSGATFSGAFRWDGLAWERVGEDQGLPQVYYHKIRRGRNGDLWFLGLRSISPEWLNQIPNDDPGAIRFADGKFTQWNSKTGLTGRQVYAFAEASDGTLWFGTVEGLSRYRHGQWTHWTMENGLRHGRVFTLVVDREDRVWFGDQLNGLGTIDEQDEVHFFTEADGLISDRIWDLSVGKDGTLWIATDGGLGGYRDGGWLRFGLDSGLSNSHLWPVNAAADQVYLGSRGGGLHILSLAEDRQPGPRVTIAPPAIEPSRVSLRWHPASYWGQVASARLQTRYRVDDRDWSDWSTKHEATLMGWPAAHHTLAVQVKGLFGKTGTATMPFVIPAPFYRRPEFVGAVSLCSAVVLLLLGVQYSRRRQYQRALQESEQRLRLVLDLVPHIICAKDSDGKFLLVNKTAAERYGMTPRELVGRRMEEVCDDSAEFRLVLDDDQEVIRSGERYHVPEESYQDAAGVTHYFETTRIRFESHDGKPAVLLIGIDITQRKQAEEQLRMLSSAVEQSNEGVAVLSLEGTVLFLNEAFARMHEHRVTDLVGKHYSVFHKPEQMGGASTAVRQIIETGEYYGELWHVRRCGAVFPTQMQCSLLRDPQGAPWGIIGTARDITEQKRVEQELTGYRHHLEEMVERRTQELEDSRRQLRRSERLASIGTLASGIAHEINNPLGMMLLTADAALDCDNDPETTKKSLNQIRADVKRCARVVQSVLRFAREQPSEKSPVQINEVVRDAMEITREYARRHGVTVTEYLAESLLPITGNATELEQVFVNLIYNAVHAYQAGGSVQIETSAEGQRVRAEVRDDGCGMTKDQVERAFDPFYTTRITEGGTGLGLSTCHGIVTEHGGTIDIESREGRGTRMIVEFPVADVDPAKEAGDGEDPRS